MLFTKHVVYLWHVNKNLLKNYELLFEIEKTWQEFYSHWYGVLYSATKLIFKEKWMEF